MGIRRMPDVYVILARRYLLYEVMIIFYMALIDTETSKRIFAEPVNSQHRVIQNDMNSTCCFNMTPCYEKPSVKLVTNIQLTTPMGVVHRIVTVG